MNKNKEIILKIRIFLGSIMIFETFIKKYYETRISTLQDDLDDLYRLWTI